MSLIIYVPIGPNRFIDVDSFCVAIKPVRNKRKRVSVISKKYPHRMYCEWYEPNTSPPTKLCIGSEKKNCQALIKALQTLFEFCRHKKRKKKRSQKCFLLTPVFLSRYGQCLPMLEFRLQPNVHKWHGTLCSIAQTLYVLNLSNNFSVKSNFTTLIKGRKAQCTFYTPR